MATATAACTVELETSTWTVNGVPAGTETWIHPSSGEIWTWFLIGPSWT